MKFSLKNSKICFFSITLMLGLIFTGLPLNDTVWAADYDSGVSYEEFMNRQVVAGGQSVGILLQTTGASVVGYAPVETSDGGSVSPGKDSGVKVGDFITAVNDKAVNTDEEIAEIIDECGKTQQDVTLSVDRDGKKMKLAADPVYSEDTETYRIGLYIRDNTAGVGTMTFYEPESRIFGALGHKIEYLADRTVDTEDIGNLLSADIQEVKKGAVGEPGEKIGFFAENGINGTINLNSHLGIFGTAQSGISNSLYPNKMSIAKVDEVKKGPAKILTVLNGNKIDEYDIDIEKIMPLAEESGQGMIIKITDKELLQKTGGIIQGMSGSPIIQNGKLAGAVTHVFVNDPTSGYACYAEWMIKEITE
ncbi:MAG: SpoIVB peptidase [Bacillota bacterium]